MSIECTPVPARKLVFTIHKELTLFIPSGAELRKPDWDNKTWALDLVNHYPVVIDRDDITINEDFYTVEEDWEVQDNGRMDNTTRED